MVASSFTQALAFVLEDEGGDSDDPQDHGGRTSRGITQAEWNAWRNLHPTAGLPEDVWDAPQTSVENIYHDHYWAPWCDKLPVGLDYLYFDFCVNAGPSRATKTLQRAIGIADDGIFGPVTLMSATAANPSLLVVNFSEQKRKFYRSLRQPRFLKGWLARCDRAEDRAVNMLPTKRTFP